MRRLLLISNSTCHASGYLDHCASQIEDFLGSSERVLFVPYALHDHDKYAARACERFERLGRKLTSVHAVSDKKAAVHDTEAVFIGGGNTFRLLKRLWDEGLVEEIRSRAGEGMPYIGTSAGSNVACVSIRTTNDMPIVEPPTFEALCLVSFNINPHYLDPDPESVHQGETRDERLREFLEENDRSVVGLREGAMLRVEGDRVELLGTTGAKLFARGHEPRELGTGARLDQLLLTGSSSFAD